MEVSSADAVALCSGISPCAPPSAATGTLEIARRRRGARGRAEAASSGDWATAGLENVLDRVDGEGERSPARARRAPPAAVAMAGVDGL